MFLFFLFFLFMFDNFPVWEDYIDDIREDIEIDEDRAYDEARDNEEHEILQNVRVTATLHRDRLVYTIQSIELHKNGVNVFVYNGETTHNKQYEYDDIVYKKAKEFGWVSWTDEIKSSFESEFLKKLPDDFVICSDKNTRILSPATVFLGAWETKDYEEIYNKLEEVKALIS